MKLKLVEDWRQAWKWLSVQLSAGIVLWLSLPPDTQASIVGGLFPPERVPLVLAVLVVVGRLIQQGAPK